MKIILVCSGGMSTSILVEALKKEAVKNKITSYEAIAIGAHQIEDYIKNYEYVLVAPQIKHKFAKIEELVKSYNKKVYLIQPMEYTPIGAPQLFKNILKL